MITTFKVILLMIIILSFFTMTEEKEDKGLQEKMLTTFLASLAAFIVSVLWL